MRYRCIICGHDGNAKAIRKYCEKCLLIVNKERSWVWHTKNYHYKGPYSEEIKCMDCDTVIVVKSPNKRRCEKCQRIHNNKASVESKRKNQLKYMVAKKIATHKRREKLRKNGESVTSEQVLTLAMQQNHCCYYCGDSFFINGTLEYYFEIEHKTPVSRGGAHDISNIALACKECNLRKGIKTAEEFIGVNQWLTDSI